MCETFESQQRNDCSQKLSQLIGLRNVLPPQQRAPWGVPWGPAPPTPSGQRSESSLAGERWNQTHVAQHKHTNPPVAHHLRGGREICLVTSPETDGHPTEPKHELLPWNEQLDCHLSHPKAVFSLVTGVPVHEAGTG